MSEWVKYIVDRWMNEWIMYFSSKIKKDSISNTQIHCKYMEFFHIHLSELAVFFSMSFFSCFTRILLSVISLFLTFVYEQEKSQKRWMNRINGWMNAMHKKKSVGCLSVLI